MQTQSSTETFIAAALKKYPKAKTIAVENFCVSAPDDHMANSINLNADARSYKWNAHTVNAIKYVLRAENKI